MAASLAGLYGGGFGQSQEDGSGGRSGFFNRGGKKGFGGFPQNQGSGSAQTDQQQSQQQQQNPQYLGGGTGAEFAQIKE